MSRAIRVDLRHCLTPDVPAKPAAGTWTRALDVDAARHALADALDGAGPQPVPLQLELPGRVAVHPHVVWELVEHLHRLGWFAAYHRNPNYCRVLANGRTGTDWDNAIRAELALRAAAEADRGVMP